jgi:hypothetical protein
MKPGGVIECTSCDASCTRQCFNGHADGSTAGGTELYAQQAIALVGSVVVRLESAGRELDIVLLEIGHEAERASCPALTESAVTHCRPDRGIGNAVTHCTAETSAFVSDSHFLGS